MCAKGSAYVSWQRCKVSRSAVARSLTRAKATLRTVYQSALLAQQSQGAQRWPVLAAPAPPYADLKGVWLLCMH